MEAWTFINKENNNIIRCAVRTGDIEFGDEYYFTTSKYSPLWFVETEDDILKSLNSYDHPQYNMFWNTPSKDKININDYKIIKMQNTDLKTDVEKLTSDIIKYFPKFFDDFKNWEYGTGVDAGKDFERIFKKANKINKKYFNE